MAEQVKPEGDIWRGFCSALGAEYRDHRHIHNPRIAALMRVDVQADGAGR